MNLLVKFSIILMGYLIGSVSPSYILGKWLKKIDIREHGTQNAGTVNTYKVLGLWPAIITALFDLSKGLLAMYLAHLLGASPLFMHLVGFAAIIGHCFPFYLNFRGGQGVAIATSIMIYYLILFYKNAWLPWDSLILLAFCVGCFIFIARRGEIIGLVIQPTLGFFVLVFSPHQIYQILILTVIAYILFINLLNIRQEQLLRSSSEKMKKEINYENIELIKPERREDLIKDLEERTGLTIHKVEIGRIDFLRDTARVYIYFFAQNDWGHSSEDER